MKKITLLISLMLWAGSMLAQSFNSLKRETAKPFVPELHDLVITNNIAGMRENLRLTPANANNGSVNFEGKQFGKYQKAANKTMPLLFDVINNCIAGACGPEMLDVVLDAKADMYAPFNDMPPLYFLLDYIAVTPKEFCSSQEMVLGKLIEHHIDVKIKFRDKPEPLSFLMHRTREYAGKYSDRYVSDNVIKMLVDAGADVNSYDADGNNLLTYISETNNNDLIDYLFSKGINVTAGSNSDIDPVYIAIDKGNAEMVEKIMEKGYKIDVRELSSRLNKLTANREIYQIVINNCLSNVRTWNDADLFHNRLGSISDADNRLEEKLKKEFMRDGNTDDKSVYYSYISILPNGKYVNFAKTRLRQIIDAEDDAKFAKASTINTPEAYKKYLKEYPYGLHAKEAKNRSYDIETAAINKLFEECKRHINDLDQVNQVFEDNLKTADEYVRFYSDIMKEEDMKTAADIKAFMSMYSFLSHGFRCDYTRGGFELKIAVNRGLTGLRRNCGFFGALLLGAITPPVGIEDCIDFGAIDYDVNRIKKAYEDFVFFCEEYNIPKSTGKKYYDRLTQKQEEIVECVNNTNNRVAAVYDQWDKTFMSASSVSESINLAINKKIDSQQRANQANLLRMFGFDASADDLKRQDCMQCEVDDNATYEANAKNSNSDKWKIVMKNGTEYEYTINSKGKYEFVGTGFLSNDEFDKPEQLVERMIKNCKIRYCE